MFMLTKLDIDVCIPTIRGVPDQIIDEVEKEITGKIHISKTKPLVKARVELISKVETNLFLFLDDDIIYKKNLLHDLFAHYSLFSNDGFQVGAVQGSTVPYGLGDKWDHALTKIFVPRFVKYGERLMSSNMLIKTSLVKDWKPVNDISGCEDLSLTLHIQDKGFKCLLVPLQVKHKRSWKKIRSNSEWYVNGFINVVGRNKGFKQLLLSLLASLKYLFLFPFNWRLSFYSLYQNFFTQIAFIKRLLIEGS